MLNQTQLSLSLCEVCLFVVLYRVCVCVCVQGLGLYAARDIEKCTMVIEYIGTIIRSEVANRKERLYEAQVTLALSSQTYVAHRHLGLGSDHVRCVTYVCGLCVTEPWRVHVPDRQRLRHRRHHHRRTCEVRRHSPMSLSDADI